MKKKILCIPGDGIGQEVMREAQRLVKQVADRFAITLMLDEVDWGADKWLREGIGLPTDALEILPKNYDAILFGALGDPRIPDMAHGREILLGLRFGLDLYINLRTVKILHPRLHVLRHAAHDAIDMVIFRENTEDIYRGLGKAIDVGSESELTIDESLHSYNGVKRIIEAAFAYTHKQGRKKLCLVDKANAIKFGGRLWSRVFKDVAQKFPHITTEHLFVDVAAMMMVQDPARFDVIVTTNLFGDILSDLGAGLIGGLGLAASANINPHKIALFEPVHGSAPDIAFKNQANPLAMFLSVAMMFCYFDRHDIARHIEHAVVNAIDANNVTIDLGGHLTCSDASEAVLALI